MPPDTPTLHLICGKIAAGKSTLAARIAGETGALVIAEDEWLQALYDDQLTGVEDYARCTRKLRKALGPHIAALLNTGVSVVLDFAANTPQARAWVRGILERTGAAHRLHLLETPDAVCLERLAVRNAVGTHPFTVTEAQFHAFMRYFQPPTDDEGFDIIRHSGA
jgi:predicted kinase